MKRYLLVLLILWFCCGIRSFSFAQLSNREIIDTTANGITSIAVEDMNNDGFEDIVIAQKFGYNEPISLYFGNGLGEFGAAIHIVQSAEINWTNSLSVGDLNNDGWKDIVFTSILDSVQSFVINNNGSFLAPQALDSIPFPMACKMVDMDNDSDLDILVLGDNQLLNVYYNNGSLNFTKVQTEFVSPYINSGTEYYAFDIADINDDGLPDAVVGGVGTFVFINDSGFLFVDSLRTIASRNLDNALEFNIVLEDLNNDSFPDLILNNNGSLRLSSYLNDGNGYFNFQNIIDSSAIQLESIFCSDMNADGTMDIVAAHPLSSGNKIKIYYNNGTTGFSSQNIYQADMDLQDYCQRVVCQDINTDGKPDLIWSEKLSIHLNDASNDVNDDDQLKTVQIFPNPANHNLNIRIENPNNKLFRLEIKDILGRNLYSLQIHAESTNIPIDCITYSGIAIVQLISQDKNQVVFSTPIVIE
jgi:hypothetical protein